MHLPGAKRRNLGAKSPLSQAEVLTRIPQAPRSAPRRCVYAQPRLFAICHLLFVILRMPKIVRFHEVGDASVLKLEELPKPHPKEGEVLLKVQAIGLNR